MAKFFYIVRDKSGKRIKGAEQAANQDELISRLQAKNLVVINILPEIDKAKLEVKTESVIRKGFRRRHYRITSDDLVLFCRQFSTLLGAGVPILKSLHIISRQVSSRRLYNVIKDISKNMEAGFSLHETMAKHRGVFSELWINLTESGEASGNLAMVLGRLASYLERAAAFRRKIISMAIYPSILLIVGIAALLFLVIRIIPNFATILSDFNTTLPLLTRMLIGFSNFIRRSIFIISLLILAGVFLFRRYVSTRPGRRQFEKFKFNLPLFGDLFRVLVTEKFTAEMATLLESGVPILYALELAEHGVNNLTLASIIRDIREDVRSGRSLSEPMDRSGFFEPMAVQIVTVGEEVGELPAMFKRINTFYQEYIDTFMTRFTSLFEPIMLVFMGIVIGIMVIGMFLPIFQIATLKPGSI